MKTVEQGPDRDFDRGHEIFLSFVRGDALIGIVGDVPGSSATMVDALWAAASRQHPLAYRLLGDCYGAGAGLKTLGAFDGVSADDAESRTFSADAQSISHDDSDALQATLRVLLRGGPSR
jgi:hypothetical protein